MQDDPEPTGPGPAGPRHPPAPGEDARGEDARRDDGRPDEVTSITVERETGVTLVFADGHECRFALEDLRRHCPCAGCRNAREAGRDPWPGPASPLPLSVTDAELTGAWGIRFVWNDRHGTGIYPWSLLREWCETGTRVLRPDSGLAG